MKRFTVILTATAFLACSGSSKNTTTTATGGGTGTPSDTPAEPAPAVPADSWTMDDGPMADDQIGLSKTSVFDDPVPANYDFPKGEPGENKLIARSYIGAPPQIPHQVEDYLPITNDENTCQACHQTDVLEPGGPTPVPKSHYEDYRRKPGVQGTDLYTARWRCMACHVVQSDAPPLVDSNFKAQP